MPHIFGALPIPVPVAGAGESVGDRAIDALAGYFSAVLTTYAAAAWAAVAPNEPIIRKTFKSNPEEGDFNAADLPALYVWREKGVPDWLADDFEVDNAPFNLLWVPPTTAQGRSTLRESIFNAVTKTLQTFARRQRDPAWVKVGDLDPTAAARGSVLLRWAGLMRLDTVGSERTTLSIKLPKYDMLYPAVLFTMTGTELLVEDLEANGFTPEVDLKEFAQEIGGLLTDHAKLT